jgi:hypothetical protein
MPPTETKAPYWQICMSCDRRQFSGEPMQCLCGEKMVDALEHPDNDFRKPPPGKKPDRPKPPTVA